MGFLTDYEDHTICFRGREYILDLAYDTVLNIQRMLQERKLDDADLLMEALKLFGIPEKAILPSTQKEAVDLLQEIFEQKVQTKMRPKVGKQKKLFDFEEDGEYVYASFMQDYGIDLIDMQGKLPWQRFIALFQGLSDQTKIKEVMRIRGMELPEATKNNQKEIQNLMELKSYYALPVEGGGGKQGLDNLFGALERMAAT